MLNKACFKMTLNHRPIPTEISDPVRAYLSLVLTAFALVGLVSQVGYAHEATQVTDVNPVRVGHLE